MLQQASTSVHRATLPAILSGDHWIHLDGLLDGMFGPSVAEDENESCLSDPFGVTEHGRTVYSTVNVPAHGRIEISDTVRTSRYKPEGFDELLPHPIETLDIKC